MKNYASALEAAKLIKSGDRVFIHSIACPPTDLINAMVARANELRKVEIVQIHTEGPAPYTDEKYKDSFRVNAMFVGSNCRKAVNEFRADYIPIFLSEVPHLFESGAMPLDVALVQVSPPDKHGMCSLGPAVAITLAAVRSAKLVIAEINQQLPRVHGDGIIPINSIGAVVEANHPIFEIPIPKINDVESRIGNHVASLVENGATLQMGIGSIPNAVLAALGNHKRLGIHTEMFSDGIIDLVQRGIITGEEKVKHPNKIVSGFAMGTRKLYDFIDDNPIIHMISSSYTNCTAIIRQNPKVTAINSAIEVDITGQVCADSIGPRMYSGVGGQMDFMRGASLSPGGKPIIALPSTTSKGESRIVPFLKLGAGVVTTRAHVHYIVTEYGVAHLYAKNLRERARALINIAHPNHQEAIEKASYEFLGPL